jgi:hypothetical protein
MELMLEIRVPLLYILQNDNLETRRQSKTDKFYGLKTAALIYS